MDHSLSFLYKGGSRERGRAESFCKGVSFDRRLNRCLNFGNQTSYFVDLLLFLYDFGRKESNFYGYVSI